VDLEHRRRIGGRVEADADQVHAALQRRVILQFFLDGRKVLVHQGAERRHRAFRVDERHQQGRTLECLEGALLAVLIDERGVGNGFAGFQQLEAGGRRWRRNVGGSFRQRRLAHLPDVRQICIAREHNQFRVDQVAGR
jgi:hypothetical protein